MPSTVTVKVWGDLACFTRPELKVERLSYPVMTPSAARGVLDAILWKPQMRWHVRRIDVLTAPMTNGSDLPYRLVGIRRNEIQGKLAPRTVGTWMEDPAAFTPYLVDSAGRDGPGGQNRTQRNSLVLRDVAYVIHASPLLTPRANRPRVRPPDADESPGPDSIAKYVGMFQRRVAKGQCFHRPYLGCREFAAQFAPAEPEDRPMKDWTEDLGLMLYDISFGDVENRPGFFHARVRQGILHCDTLDSGPAGEPPIHVLGWTDSQPREIAS